MVRFWILPVRDFPFGVLSILDFIHSGFRPFWILPIRDFAHSRFRPIWDFVQFGILSNSGFCPIRDFVQFGILFFGILYVNVIIAVSNFQTFSYCSFFSAYEPIFILKSDYTVKCNLQNAKRPPLRYIFLCNQLNSVITCCRNRVESRAGLFGFGPKVDKGRVRV